MSKTGKRVVKGVLAVSLLTIAGLNGVSANEVEVDPKVEQYNFERTAKLAIEDIVKEYEVNAILKVTGIQEWNTESKPAEPLGQYQSIDEVFNKIGKNREEHEQNYNKYKENEIKLIEEQEDLPDLTNLDYLSVSGVSVSYYYDATTLELAQLIRIKSESKVYRCTIIYNASGQVVNYFEV